MGRAGAGHQRQIADGSSMRCEERRDRGKKKMEGWEEKTRGERKARDSTEG